MFPIARYIQKMKLRQGQIWERSGEFIHVVEVARLEVKFKLRKSLSAREGTHQTLSKKEFCRLLKTAQLVPTLEARVVAGCD